MYVCVCDMLIRLLARGTLQNKINNWHRLSTGLGCHSISVYMYIVPRHS